MLSMASSGTTSLHLRVLVVSQMLSALPDPTNDSNSLWGDSAFAGLTYRAFLESAGFQSYIRKKCTRNHPLSVDAKARKSMRSKTRARVEHVFGQMVMTMKREIFQVDWDQSDNGIVGNAQTRFQLPPVYSQGTTAERSCLIKVSRTCLH